MSDQHDGVELPAVAAITETLLKVFKVVVTACRACRIRFWFGIPSHNYCTVLYCFC